MADSGDLSKKNIVLYASPRELGFSNRSLNCCRNVGVQWIGDLIGKTEAELLRIPNMGRTSLNEMKNILAKYDLSLGMDNSGWNDTDPKLVRTSIPGGIRFALSQLEEGAEIPDATTLQEEVRRTIAKVADARNASIVLTLWGLDGTSRKTLEEVGQSFGMTRERVRQIEARVIRRLRDRWHKMPLFDAALSSVQSHSPMACADLTEHILGAGIETDFISGAALIQGCEVFERQEELIIANDLAPGLIGSREDIQEVRRSIRILRRETSSLGCSSLSRIQFQLSGEIAPSRALRSGLGALNEVFWLDHARHWLISKNPTRNRVFNILEKIFSVSESVHLSELRQAVGRPHRMSFVPPAEILASLCEYFGFTRSTANMITTPHLLDAEFGELNATFVKAFRECGSPITREELEEYCVGVEGMNVASFYQYLSYSPLVTKLAYGVYGLVGAPSPPGAVDSAKRRVGQDRIPAEHGWTPTGRLWFVFHLTRASVNSGAFFVPSFVNTHAEGIWSIQLSSGALVGRAEIKQGIAAGFKGALQLLGADARDFCLIQFDLTKHLIHIDVGGSDLEDRASNDISQADASEPDDSEDSTPLD